MAPRIVDPTKFLLLGSVVDWTLAYRKDLQQLSAPDKIAGDRGLKTTRMVQLRWVMDPAMGYPTEPFTVWSRRSELPQNVAPIDYVTQNFFGFTVVVLDRPQVFVQAQLQGSSGSVMAFAGTPYASPMVGVQSVSAAQANYAFSGPSIQCLLLTTGVDLLGLTGLDGAAAQDLDWREVEIVGLPVDSSFDQVQHLDAKQGLIDNLGDPRDAALDRFRRGAPFYGWRPTLDTGSLAPPWQLADPKAMLQVVQESMLPLLRQMVDLPAEQQEAFTTTRSLISPDGNNPTAEISPLRTLAYGAATDPLASLITGFGTAFEQAAPNVKVIAYIPNNFDYMVTARYDNGTNNEPGPLEYAAIVFAPAMAPTPPTPTGVAVSTDGLAAPAHTDLDWSGVIRVGWDRLGDGLPIRVGSYALARSQVAPAGGVEAVMDPRPYDTAVQPIGASTSEALGGSGRLSALDDRYRLTSNPNPNQLSYAVAQQDLFGQWSAWASASLALGEPPVDAASLITASWDVSAAATICPGSLTIDFAWNWASRSPARIDLVGRMYPASRIGDPPADLSVAAGLAPSLGGSGSPVEVHFDSAGAATVIASAGLSGSIQYFDEQAHSLSSAVQGAVAGPRRYRLTLTGFGLDYSATPVVEMALWARGIEARAPGRVGAWSGSPLIAAAADPRPPVLVIEHEDVLLTSMADSVGEYHALLEWPAAPGAVGYFAYTCSETDLLEACGRDDPSFAATLSDRLKDLRDAFEANPTRRAFTRVNATPVAGTSLAVTLPRGTKDIHLFVVLGLSAGQIESAWPDTSDPGRRKRPIAFAAPQVVAPNPPAIEVTRRTDSSVSPATYQAAFRLAAQPGVLASRIDLYRTRVADAAIDIDTMGPPVASITGSTADITVTPTISANPGESQPLGRITGIDPVAGSWRTVYYRAIAWAADDPTRGHYGGRSGPSTIRQVVVPPPDPPDLAPLTATTPISGTPQVLVETSTSAPIPATPLGAHLIEAEAIVTHADGTSELLYRYPSPAAEGGAPDSDLDQVLQTAPAANGSGLWRDPSAATGTAIHLQLARADFADQVAVRVRLTDPLGRLTEQLITVAPTNPVVPPDIRNVNITNVAGRGRVLSFDTSVPDEAPGVGPYQVHIALRPPVSSPSPLPLPFPHGPHLPQVAQVTEDIADIRVFTAGDNIFNDPAPIPLRQVPSGSGRTIGAVLRSTGALRVDVIAPDGTQATITRTVM